MKVAPHKISWLMISKIRKLAKFDFINEEFDL